jgi:hypothetical protein
MLIGCRSRPVNPRLQATDGNDDTLRIHTKAQQITSHALRGYLPQNPEAEILISYESGEYAARLSASDVNALALKGMVYGIVKREALRSVRLTVSIKAAFRLLNQLTASAQAPPGAITKRRNKTMGWSMHLEKSKSGCAGPSRTLHIGIAQSNAGL